MVPMFSDTSEGSNMATSILRLPDVKKRTGLSRSSIYEFMKQRHFPAQIVLGARCVGWIEGEIDEWIQDRINKSRGES